MTPSNYTFVETRKGKIATWSTEITVTYEPASVSDLDQTQRWFQTVGASVTAVRRVKVMCKDADFPSAHGYAEQGFEVDFACGAKGYVTEYADSAELSALTIGSKGYLHGLAVWRKHRNIVGSPTPWFRAQPGKRSRLNPNTAPRCCAAELYARAAGKPWGEGLVLVVSG